MSYMFSGCTSLASLDLSNFRCSSLENKKNMFHGCYSLRTIKNNSESSAKILTDQIWTDLRKTATWDSTTKEITIPVKK